MQTGTTLRPRNNLGFIAAALLALALLVLSFVSMLDLRTSKTAPASVASLSGHGIAYFEFASDADTLWLADPAKPSQREKIMVAPHAVDFGVVPSLAPDGARFAYTALSPETNAPSVDAPADLWLASMTGGKPVRIAQGIDLLVAPVWSPDGSSVVVRRSGGSSAYQLRRVDVASGAMTMVVTSAEAVFPLAYAPDGGLLYVQLTQQTGSMLMAADAAGKTRTVAVFSDGLTRDWALSPAGDKLAYLEMTLTTERMASRARVLDLATGAIAPAGDENADAFRPVWKKDGSLVVGRLAAGEKSAGMLVGGSVLAGPKRGFDVPMAAGSNGYIAQSFDGSSLRDPGASVLTLVGPSGEHVTIATGEVTFLGWIEP
jgi:dipeptidyl aminopeptidase/acylaminoacyl peptidase